MLIKKVHLNNDLHIYQGQSQELKLFKALPRLYKETITYYNVQTKCKDEAMNRNSQEYRLNLPLVQITV